MKNKERKPCYFEDCPRGVHPNSNKPVCQICFKMIHDELFLSEKTVNAMREVAYRLKYPLYKK